MSDAVAVPVIIDCDPGVDDVLALLLALASPELLVLAITLTHGNTTLPNALINLRKTFHALEQHLLWHPEERVNWPGVDAELRARYGVGPVVVMAGSQGPIKGEAVTAKYFHGVDGLSDITTRHPELSLPFQPTPNSHPFYTISPLSSTQGLPSLISSFPPLTIAYLALGPLTSLANLHALAPTPSASLLHHFALIAAMGGAVDAPGNTTPCAEFNIYGDPYAAEVVFGVEGVPVYLFPLDLTTSLTLPFELYTSLVDPHFIDPSAPSRARDKGSLTHFTSSFLEGTRAVMRQFGKGDAMELHDPAVVWGLVDWAKYRGAGNSVASTSTSPALAAASSPELERRRGSEMRRRVEAGGFTRSVLERRRSLEMVKSQREGMRQEGLGQLVVADGQVVQDGDELEVLEADEQDEASERGSEGAVEVRGELNGDGGEEDEEDEYGDEEDRFDDDRDFAPGWTWTERQFEVETSGRLTRGMLVVDRRASAALSPSSNLANRANLPDQIAPSPDPDNVGDRLGRLSITSQSHEEGKAAAAAAAAERWSGARVVTATPGSDSLRHLLLQRVWGVSIGLP